MISHLLSSFHCCNDVAIPVCFDRGAEGVCGGKQNHQSSFDNNHVEEGSPTVKSFVDYSSWCLGGDIQGDLGRGGMEE